MLVMGTVLINLFNTGLAYNMEKVKREIMLIKVLIRLQVYTTTVIRTQIKINRNQNKIHKITLLRKFVYMLTIPQTQHHFTIKIISITKFLQNILLLKHQMLIKIVL